MIDLHIHSTYSDGTDSVIEILKKCEEKKINLISITDHDEVKAHFELENIDIKKYYNGKIIVGAEFKTFYKEQPIEILGYGFDPYMLKDLNKEIREERIGKQERVLEHLKKIAGKINLKYSPNIKIDKGNIFAADTFQKDIFSYTENLTKLKELNISPNIGSFYRLAQNNPENIFYLPKADGKYLMPNEIIKKIKEAGGLTFLAHPLIYAFDNPLKEVEEFINNYPDIDGIECYYSLFNKQEIKALIELANKHKKYISGGSDYHGNNKNILLGKLLVEEKNLKNWLEKI